LQGVVQRERCSTTGFRSSRAWGRPLPSRPTTSSPFMCVSNSPLNPSFTADECRYHLTNPVTIIQYYQERCRTQYHLPKTVNSHLSEMKRSLHTLHQQLFSTDRLLFPANCRQTSASSLSAS
jgi:hypothetical protein